MKNKNKCPVTFESHLWEQSFWKSEIFCTKCGHVADGMDSD